MVWKQDRHRKYLTASSVRCQHWWRPEPLNKSWDNSPTERRGGHLSPHAPLSRSLQCFLLSCFPPIFSTNFHENSYLHVKRTDKVDYDSLNRVFSALESKYHRLRPLPNVSGIVYNNCLKRYFLLYGVHFLCNTCVNDTKIQNVIIIVDTFYNSIIFI